MTRHDPGPSIFEVDEPTVPLPVPPTGPIISAGGDRSGAARPDEPTTRFAARQPSGRPPASRPSPVPRSTPGPRPADNGVRDEHHAGKPPRPGPPASRPAPPPAPRSHPSSDHPSRPSAPLDSPTVRISFTRNATFGTDALTEQFRLDEIAAAGKAVVSKADPPRRDTRRTAIQLVIAGGVLPLLSLATGPLLAYFLGPEGRGYLSAILAAVLLMPFVLAIGLTDAASYLVARRKQHVGTVAFAVGSAQAAMAVVGVAALWLLAPVIMASYPPGIVLLQFAALSLLPMMALRAIAGARAGEGRYDLLVAEKWVVGLGRILVLVVLAVGGALTVASATFAQIGVVVASQFVVLIGLSRPRLRLRQLKALGGAAYSYGFRSWGGEISNVLIWRLDQVVLLPLAGAAQLGYYAVAVSLAEIPRMLVNDLRAVLLAEVASSRDARAAAKACRMSVVALAVPVFAFMAVTPFFLPLLFSQAFSPAVPMAEVLLLGTIPTGVSIFIAGSISALGRPGLQSRVRAVGVVVVVVGLFVLAPLFGGMGAAITTLVAAVTVNVGLLFAFWRITGIGPLSVIVPRLSDVRTLVGAVRRRGRK